MFLPSLGLPVLFFARITKAQRDPPQIPLNFEDHPQPLLLCSPSYSLFPESSDGGRGTLVVHHHAAYQFLEEHPGWECIRPPLSSLRTENGEVELRDGESFPSWLAETTPVIGALDRSWSEATVNEWADDVHAELDDEEELEDEQGSGDGPIDLPLGTCGHLHPLTHHPYPISFHLKHLLSSLPASDHHEFTLRLLRLLPERDTERDASREDHLVWTIREQFDAEIQDIWEQSPLPEGQGVHHTWEQHTLAIQHHLREVLSHLAAPHLSEFTLRLLSSLPSPPDGAHFEGSKEEKLVWSIKRQFDTEIAHLLSTYPHQLGSAPSPPRATAARCQNSGSNSELENSCPPHLLQRMEVMRATAVSAGRVHEAVPKSESYVTPTPESNRKSTCCKKPQLPRVICGPKGKEGEKWKELKVEGGLKCLCSPESTKLHERPSAGMETGMGSSARRMEMSKGGPETHPGEPFPEERSDLRRGGRRECANPQHLRFGPSSPSTITNTITRTNTITWTGTGTSTTSTSSQTGASVHEEGGLEHPPPTDLTDSNCPVVIGGARNSDGWTHLIVQVQDDAEREGKGGVLRCECEKEVKEKLGTQHRHRDDPAPILDPGFDAVRPTPGPGCASKMTRRTGIMEGWKSRCGDDEGAESLLHESDGRQENLGSCDKCKVRTTPCVRCGFSDDGRQREHAPIERGGLLWEQGSRAPAGDSAAVLVESDGSEDVGMEMAMGRECGCIELREGRSRACCREMEGRIFKIQNDGLPALVKERGFAENGKEEEEQ